MENKIILSVSKLGENYWAAAKGIIGILVDAGYKCEVVKPGPGRIDIVYSDFDVDVDDSYTATGEEAERLMMKGSNL